LTLVGKAADSYGADRFGVRIQIESRSIDGSQLMTA
jgi:hypothetical protein